MGPLRGRSASPLPTRLGSAWGCSGSAGLTPPDLSAAVTAASLPFQTTSPSQQLVPIPGGAGSSGALSPGPPVHRYSKAASPGNSQAYLARESCRWTSAAAAPRSPSPGGAGSSSLGSRTLPSCPLVPRAMTPAPPSVVAPRAPSPCPTSVSFVIPSAASPNAMSTSFRTSSPCPTMSAGIRNSSPCPATSTSTVSRPSAPWNGLTAEVSASLLAAQALSQQQKHIYPPPQRLASASYTPAQSLQSLQPPAPLPVPIVRRRQSLRSLSQERAVSGQSDQTGAPTPSCSSAGPQPLSRAAEVVVSENGSSDIGQQRRASWAYLSDGEMKDLAGQVLRGLVAPTLLQRLSRREIVSLLTAQLSYEGRTKAKEVTADVCSGPPSALTCTPATKSPLAALWLDSALSPSPCAQLDPQAEVQRQARLEGAQMELALAKAESVTARPGPPASWSRMRHGGENSPLLGNDGVDGTTPPGVHLVPMTDLMQGDSSASTGDLGLETSSEVTSLPQSMTDIAYGSTRPSAGWSSGGDSSVSAILNRPEYWYQQERQRLSAVQQSKPLMCNDAVGSVGAAGRCPPPQDDIPSALGARQSLEARYELSDAAADAKIAQLQMRRPGLKSDVDAKIADADAKITQLQQQRQGVIAIDTGSAAPPLTLAARAACSLRQS